MPRLRRGIFFVQPFPLSAKFGTMEKTRRKRASVCVPFPPPPSPTRWQSCVSKPTLTCPRHRLRPGPHPPGGALASCQRDPGPAVGQSGACGAGRTCLSVRTRGWPVCLWSWGQEVHIQGDFEQAVHEGVRRGYGEGYLRKSIVG